MHLSSLSTWTQRKGNCPLPLQPIPKTNNKTKINNKTKSNNKTNNNNKTKTKNKIKVVYTEDLTHPGKTAAVF